MFSLGSLGMLASAGLALITSITGSLGNAPIAASLASLQGSGGNQAGARDAETTSLNPASLGNMAQPPGRGQESGGYQVDISRFEGVAPEEVLSEISSLPVEQVAQVLASMDPGRAAEVLGLVPPDKAAEVLGLMAPSNADSAAGILAAMSEDRRNAIMAALPDPASGPIREALQGILAAESPVSQPASPPPAIWELPPADAAAILDGMTPEEALNILGTLPPQTVAAILGAMSPEQAAPILGLVPADRAAEVLGLMSGTQADAILAVIQDSGRRSEIQALLSAPSEEIDAGLAVNAPEEAGATAPRGNLASMPPDKAAEAVRAMDPGRAARELASLEDPGKIAMILYGLTDKEILRLLTATETAQAAVIASGLEGRRAGRIFEKLPSPGVAAGIMKAMPLAAVQGQVPSISAEVLAEYARQVDPHISALAFEDADPWQLADAMGRLSVPRAGDILSAMPDPDKAAEVLVSMPDGKAGSILAGMSEQEIEAILANAEPERAALVLSMAGDRAADIIGSLAPEVLAQIPSDGRDLAAAGADPWLATLLGGNTSRLTKIVAGLIP